MYEFIEPDGLSLIAMFDKKNDTPSHTAELIGGGRRATG
jgi:hypothetical protein